jgi:uncharacterized protein (TIGR03437 family)
LHAICLVRISGQARLLTVANHRLWYPSQVSLLGARRGRVLEEYWHPGAIQALLVYDADRDGHDDLVFAAINNPGDGLGHAALGVLKLPFSKARQTEARRGASLPALTGGGEWAYVLFPLAIVSRVAGLLPIPEELSIDQLGRIRVKLPLPDGGAALYYLNGNLEVAECRFSDNFPAMHERYHRRGLLDHPLTARERTALCQVAPFTVTQAGAAPAGNRPVINAGGVLNGADYTADIAPAMMVSIFGRNLAPRTATARAIPLPQELEGVSVEVTEPSKTAVRTPLYFVSPGQINLQMPFGITGSSVEVRVRTAAGTSDPARVAIVPRAPRLFTRTLDGRGEAIALHVNYRLVGEGDPVEQGRYLILYATGLGEGRPQAIAGNPGGDGGRWGPLNEVTEPVRVTVGGKPATVLFAGLAPGMAGVYQINLQLAPDVPTGRQPVVVSIGQRSSQDNVWAAVGPRRDPAEIVKAALEAQVRGDVAGMLALYDMEKVSEENRRRSREILETVARKVAFSNFGFTQLATGYGDKGTLAVVRALVTFDVTTREGTRTMRHGLIARLKRAAGGGSAWIWPSATPQLSAWIAVSERWR